MSRFDRLAYVNVKLIKCSKYISQDSVNDLMATIARLDSNGIKVIPETNRKPGDSPLVDSSTGPPIDHLVNDCNDNSHTKNSSTAAGNVVRIWR